MRVLDLFSGIGGFSLGLERAGMRTVAFCEIEPYCRAVLRKHWPNVPIFEDVRTLTAADVPGVDVICGGFPCQDISLAGKGAGLAGERSGLWREYARLIGEIRPRYVIVENVSGLLGRGLGSVLGDLAEIGYDAEWHCIPASYIGARHIRDRLWIVAYATGANAWRDPGESQGKESVNRQPTQFLSDSSSGCFADQPDDVADSAKLGGKQCWGEQFNKNGQAKWDLYQWEIEPDVGRVAHGVPARTHRLRSLGNAVVPQIPEIIGRAIMRSEGLIE